MQDKTTNQGISVSSESVLPGIENTFGVDFVLCRPLLFSLKATLHTKEATLHTKKSIVSPL